MYIVPNYINVPKYILLMKILPGGFCNSSVADNRRDERRTANDYTNKAMQGGGEIGVRGCRRARGATSEGGGRRMEGRREKGETIGGGAGTACGAAKMKNEY